MGMTRRSGTWPLGVVLLVVWLLVAASAAHAGASSVQIPDEQRASTVLTPSAKVVLEADVIPKDWCRVGLSHTGADPARSAPHVASGGLAEFSWRVPKSVAAGKWRTIVRCAPSRLGLLRERGKAATVTLRTSRQGREHHGTAAQAISVTYLHDSFFPAPGVDPSTGKGGGAYPPYGALLIAGSAWLDGQGVNVYSNGSDGNEQGAYQCVELVNRLITTRGWSPSIYGNANQLYGDASTTYFNKYGNGGGYQPVPGDIVVWGGGTGGFGHVAVVDANSGGRLTVVEENASPSGYGTYPISSSGYIAPTAYGYYVEGFLHPKADHTPATGGIDSGGGSGSGGLPGGTAGLSGSPAVMIDPAGEEAYYRGSNGDLTEAAWTGGALKILDLGHQMQGTPAVFYDPANGEEEVYYEGGNGDLDMSYWKGGNLSFLDLGIQTTASPAAMYDGTEEVYFRGSNGDLMEFAWGAPADPLDLGHQMQGTPAVFYDPANGEEEVYYEGGNGDLDMSYWKGGNLSFLDLGIQTTASPAAMYDGTKKVYFRGSNGYLMEFAWGAPAAQLALGHQMQGTPAVFYAPANGEEEVYYEGGNGDLDMSYWKGGNLSFLDLGSQK